MKLWIDWMWFMESKFVMHQNLLKTVYFIEIYNKKI